MMKQSMRNPKVQLVKKEQQNEPYLLQGKKPV
jgi:hypothetical protein